MGQTDVVFDIKRVHKLALAELKRVTKQIEPFLSQERNDFDRLPRKALEFLGFSQLLSTINIVVRQNRKLDGRTIEDIRHNIRLLRNRPMREELKEQFQAFEREFPAIMLRRA